MAKKPYRPLREDEKNDLQKSKVLFLKHNNAKNVVMHDHAFLELSYIFRGTVEHNLDGQVTNLGVGDYLIVDYGSCHSYKARCAEGFANFDLIFLPELLDPVLKGTKSLRALLEHYLLHFNPQALVQNPARMVFHDTTGRIRELLQLIENELNNRQAGYTEVLRCHIIEILVLTLRQLDDAQAAAKGEDISAFLTAYVAEHYMEPLTLCDLAARLNYSLPYISKKFKDDMGISFVHYLQNYRIMQGCRLLSSTKKSLGEIAELVGYHDIKFFSSLLKRTTGLSPADFRRQYGK